MNSNQVLFFSQDEYLQVGHPGSLMEKYGFSLWVVVELLPQVNEFKYLRLLLTSEGTMEMDRWVGAVSRLLW